MTFLKSHRFYRQEREAFVNIALTILNFSFMLSHLLLNFLYAFLNVLTFKGQKILRANSSSQFQKYVHMI